MNIRKILTPEDHLKVVAARELKTKSKDIDFEAKEHHGSYADDEVDCKHEESYKGLCVECGEPYQMGVLGKEEKKC